jgi:hypothetical protein
MEVVKVKRATKVKVDEKKVTTWWSQLKCDFVNPNFTLNGVNH